MEHPNEKINWKKGDVLEDDKGFQYMFGHYQGRGYWVHRITKSGKMDNSSLGLYIARESVKPATLDVNKRGGWPARKPKVVRMSAASIRKKPRRKQLPKGLQEFEASLHDLEYAQRLLPRLLDLPCGELKPLLNDFHVAMTQVSTAEAAARNARNLARECALLMWRTAGKLHTLKQLKEATGYDDE